MTGKLWPVAPRSRRSAAARHSRAAPFGECDPTARGRAFFEDACDVRAELETEFLSKLSATRRAAFVAMLDDLIGITR